MADALSRYRAKRRFDETREPDGAKTKTKTKTKTKGEGALYIIQKHEATRQHYDFRLELDGVLLSWAVTRGPSYNTKDKRLAVRTEDHPLDYGAFEGTIPKGNYGGGTVMLWDKGTWAPQGDAKEGLKKGKLAFVLSGERLRGKWALVRMKTRGKEKTENWLLIKENDELANTHEDLLEESLTSVVSGREMEAIAAGPEVWTGTGEEAGGLPAFCEPMLATLVEVAPEGKDWLFEIKYDGYRALIAADGGQVKVYTRSGLDWTAKFPQVVKAVAARKFRGVLIDTEICVLDAQGRSDFGALVSALEAKRGNMTALAFDLLFADGEDLRGETLLARKARLRRLLGKTGKDAALVYSEEFAASAKDTGEKLLAAACANNLEGIIAKKTDAPYRAGRHGAWLKVKCGKDQEFVIVGFSASDKARAFASVLLAAREDGGLRYAGRVGSGFSEAILARLSGMRDRLKVKTPAVDVPASLRKGVIWVKPDLVAQIEFAGWTRDHLVRHGRFKGLREDKKAGAVVVEKPVKAAKAQVTHGEKVMFADAGITKQALADYVAAASTAMLPYAKNRYLSLVRAPDGVAKKHFFQRHPAAGFGEFWLARDVTTPKGAKESYIYFEKAEALAAAVQMGVVEFHIWGARVDDAMRPDRIVFDLDPDEAVGFGAVKAAALRVRDVLDALGLQSFALLSGGKGIHVVAPVMPGHDWPVVKAFAAQVAARMVEDAPKDFVATMTKAKRAGKIFIDHFRNDFGSTAIAPYSPRARESAAVAWPVAWAALDGFGGADEMTMEKAAAALAKGENGWVGYGKIKQKLSHGALKALGVV
jgi:bifunctional non-homologous end joining protein LigD